MNLKEEKERVKQVSFEIKDVEVRQFSLEKIALGSRIKDFNIDMTECAKGFRQGLTRCAGEKSVLFLCHCTDNTYDCVIGVFIPPFHCLEPLNVHVVLLFHFEDRNLKQAYG